ncbi:DUF3857 domain-containing protein [Algibacter luteus]|uniref:DUF3857 domain-containing protein n=1 Tax=Algibacter luteus TaxID=1178825 RepID=UPI002598280A|nr:DUF3857 domain-containing protein [Algibacter luteus]WJJ95165.1 DUF3857 domain-containing protein [Algibacter luteus]
MKKYILPILLFTASFALSQENYNTESYSVSLEDIESSTFVKDSTANAFVIYEYGNSYIHKYDYDLRTEEKYKIKIINREGFENANVVIYQYKNSYQSERVEDIFGATYNMIDGKVVKTQLQEQDIYKEQLDENRTIIKFTLPNIKEGSVITYSYKTRSPFIFKYHGWDFQSEIPKLYSEYNTSIPGNYLYNIKLVGGQKLVINESAIEKKCLETFRGASADCAVSKYAMKDIPAFIEEDYMTTKSNYLARIEYELQTFKGMDGTVKHYTKTWDAVDKELRTDKEIGKQLKKKVDAEEILPTSIFNEADDLKKAKAIFQFVQENYTWNEEYKLFTGASINDIIKTKSGNVSSINILLHNLLKESDIEVKPVLLSTRENGFPTTLFPVLSDFNYQIVQAKINNKTYLLDATDNYLNFGEIPFRCLNDKGRLVDFKNGSSWIDLKPSTPSKVFYNVEINLNDVILSGNVNTKRTGYHAFNSRKLYYKNNSEYLNKLENRHPDLEILDFEVISESKTSPDFKEAYNIEYNYAGAGDKIYLNPFIFKFFNENPLKLQERTYPIDFGYEDSYYYLFKLELNDEYEVIEMPKTANLILPNNTGQILLNAYQIGENLNILFKIDFNKSIYEVEYYPYLKEFMAKIVDIQNNSLILLEKTK